jgi:hypothetical protein
MAYSAPKTKRFGFKAIVTREVIAKMQAEVRERTNKVSGLAIKHLSLNRKSGMHSIAVSQCLNVGECFWLNLLGQN